ncbi:hypothetical protein MIR68_005523 [Amoeboaphelidium protococcarum]|nr:hypothetical protein MIR68_005523 [Amoeboaphelidium protococcarum]
MYWPYAVGGFLAGSAMEYLLITFNFYEHIRVSESRKRLKERMDIDDAVERLMRRDPGKFQSLADSWERIKIMEDSEEEQQQYEQQKNQ